MIIKENITVYQCEHCKKKLFKKHAMEKHIKFCSQNPVNIRACFDCEFLKREDIEYYGWSDDSNYYGKETKTASGFRCTKLDKLVYHPKVEQKNLVNKYPETFEDQEPMPKECNSYKFNFNPE